MSVQAGESTTWRFQKQSGSVCVCRPRDKTACQGVPRAIFGRAPTAALHKIKRKIFISGSSSLFVEHRQQATMLQSVYNATGALRPGTLAREHRELE